MRTRTMLMLGFVVLSAVIAAPRARAAEIAKPTVDLSIYGHVSSLVWVVKDLDPVVDYWQKLGLKNVERTKITEFEGLIYRGRPTPTTARSAFGHVGGVLIEWIQPVTGSNLYTEFLRRHGNGILAIGFAVKSDAELERQIQYFRSKGVQVAERTQWKGTKGMGHGAYLDTAARGGGLTIALYHDPDGPAPGDASTSEPPNDAPLNRFNHYAFVVRHLRAVEEYWQTLGFGGMEVAHNVSTDRGYRGHPGTFEMDLGWWHLGTASFEWIESTRGPNVYEEYLKAHGEGFHHFGVDVPNMPGAVEMMTAKGAPRCQWGGWDDPGAKGQFAYLDTDPHGGVTLELIWDQPRP